MKKIKMFFVFLFAALVFATGCSIVPGVSNNTSNNTSISVTKEYYDMSGVSFNGASYVYDGEEHSLSIEGTLPEGVSVMYLNNNKINAGTYEVIAKFTGDTKNYYPIEDMKATLTIAKAGVSGISFLGDTVTYDGNPHSIEINGELPEGILVTYSGNDQVNVGTYEVVAHFTDTTGNYVELSDLKATLTINKATYDMSGIKFNSASYTYDGIEKEVKIEGKLPSGVEVLYENNRMINAGTIEAIAMFKHNNPNYNDIPNKTATLTISKASIEGISFSGDTVTYDGKSHSLSIEGKLPEGVYVTYINNGHINAGTYTVIAHFEDSTGNYEYLPDLEATLVINKVEVNEIEFNGKTVVYDGEAHSLEIEGILPSGVQVVYSNNNHINAGTYTVVASFIDTTGNYDLPSYLEATLTINKKTVEVDFNNKEVIYNGEKQILKLSSSLPEGVYAIYSDNEFINAGEYEVIVQIIDTTGNYNIEEFLKATLTINKATYDMSNISFNSASYTYDGNEKNIEISGSLPKGVSVIYSNNNQVNAGEYIVTASFKGDENNYYPINDMYTTLIINKANIEGISFIGSTLTYDGYNHSIYVDGYLPDGIIIEYYNNNNINAGEYEITAVFYDTTGNYIVPEPMTAVLKINKLTIDVSLENQTFSYDGEYHSLSLNGYIPDGISVTNINNSFNKAGEYTVTYSFNDTTGNYNIVESLEATLTIIKDGKYHDVVFTFEDGTTKEYVIANDNYLYNVPSIPYKKGHTGEWDNDTSLPITQDTLFNIEYTPNQYTITYNANGGELEEITQVVTYGEEFELYEATKVGYSISNYSYYIYSSWNTNDITSGVYLIDSDINVTINWNPNKYKVNYYDGEELLFSDEVTYDSGYTFKEMYVNDDGNLLIELKYNDEIIEPGTIINFTYLNDLNVETKYMTPSNDYEYTVSNNIATITNYIGDDSDVVIPKYLIDGKDFYKVITIREYAFSNNQKITSVVIPIGVQTIGKSVFEGCNNLEKITLPFVGGSYSSNRYLSYIFGDSNSSIPSSLKEVIVDTALEYIPSSVFSGCSNLTSIVISEGVIRIDNSAFKGCSSLTNISLPKTLLNLGKEVFGGCSSLTSIRIPERVTYIQSSLFSGCSSLTSIEWHDNITTIGDYAFSGCSSLTSVTLPSSLNSIGDYAFSGCSSLISIIIPDKVANIGYSCFSRCSSLEKVILPNTLKNIDNYAFSGCSSLTSIVLPEGISSIKEYAFYNCSNLKIFSESEEKLSTWNLDDVFVYLKGTWHYENNEPTPNQYIITYDSQGGELDEYTQVVSYGDFINLLTPTRSGFEFLGWHYNDELFEYERYEFIEDIILIAKWKEVNDEIIEKSLCNLRTNYTVTYTDENDNTYFIGIEETKDKKGIYVYFEESNNGYYIDKVNEKIYYAGMTENSGLSFDLNQQLSDEIYNKYIKVLEFKSIFDNALWKLVSNESNKIYETSDISFISLCSLLLNISEDISNIQAIFDENNKLSNFVVNFTGLSNVYTFKIENINNTNIINYGTANPMLVGMWSISELDNPSLLGEVGSCFEIINDGLTLLKCMLEDDATLAVVETFLFTGQEDPSTYLYGNDSGDIIRVKSMNGSILDENGDRLYNAGLSFTTIDAETQVVTNGIAILYYEISLISAVYAYNDYNAENPEVTTTYNIQILQIYDEKYDTFVTDLDAIGAYYISELDSEGNEVEAGIYTQWATIDDLIYGLNGLMQGGFDSTLYNGCALGFYLYATFFLTGYKTEEAVNILYNISMFSSPVYTDVDTTRYPTPTEGQSQRDYVVSAMESLGYTAIYDSYVIDGQDYISITKDNNSNEENGIICEEVVFFENSQGEFGCMLVINDNGTTIVKTYGFGYFIVIGTIYEVIETWTIAQA